MGKNHRHKKQLKSEKAKVKLKTAKTKFLPKGLNVTNTTFKIKPIVLQQQLELKDVDVPLSKRKLNVKDLLSRLKHYNENMRHGACEELCQMIKIYQEEIVQSHLSQILQVVSGLIQDKEKKVRKSAAKVVKTILECTPQEKVEPFFGFLSTNLCCAMTNIDKNIQEDSLLLLDTLLCHLPALVAKNSDKLLSNFFTLISKLRNDSSVERTLTVNLGSQLTSVKWRIKVLSRLYSMLSAIIKFQSSETPDKMDTTENNSCSGINSNTIPIFKNIKALDFCHPSFTNTVNNDNIKDNSNVLIRHIVTLVPLLFETWVEVVPEKNVGKPVTENTYLNEESAAVLSCIMNILFLLYEYIKFDKQENNISIQNVFLSVEGKKFFNHLLINFPYCQSEKSGKVKPSDVSKLLEINEDPKCVQENLLICYIFSVLHINDFQKILFKIELKTITTYITRCMYTKNYVNDVNMKYLIKLLKVCLIENSISWHKSGAKLNEILENTIYFYHSGKHSEQSKLEIFNILVEINNSHLNKSSKYQLWLSSLPDLLCGKEVSEDIVNSLLRLSRKNNVAMHNSFLKKLPIILDNLMRLKFTQTKDENKMKKDIVNILFYIPHLSSENVEDICIFLHNHPDTIWSKYFFEMLNLRLNLKYTKYFEEILTKKLLIKYVS